MEQINPQGPTVQLRELYSVSYDKSQWKRIQKAKKNVYICKLNHFAGQQELTQR